VDLGRVFLAQGRPAVIPLVPPEGLSEAARAAWVPSGPPKVVLEGGTVLSSRVFRVWGRAVVDAVSASRWMPPAVEWRAVELGGDSGAVGAGALSAGWVALVEAPSGIPERRLPKFARVDERVVELTWLPPALQNPDVMAAALPQVSAESVLGLGEMLRGDASDPQRRWRVRLVAQRFGAAALWGNRVPAGFGGVASELSEPLEAVAEQLELNARSAIDALRAADRGAALEVLNRLTAVLRTPDGVLLPAWPVGDDRAAVLMIGLLSPGVTASARVEMARRWLDESAAVQAWMIDDIGVPSVTPARFEPSVGVADLSGTGGRAWATTSAGYRGEELEVAVAPSHSVRLRMAMAFGADGARPVVEAGLNLAKGGAWSTTISPIVGRAKVMPPGLELGPVLEPWTLASWRARSAVARGESRGVTVTIQRTVGGGDEGSSGWEAVVRCRGPVAGAVGGEKDVVRLWCGAFERSRGVVVVGPGRRGEWVRASDVVVGAGEDGRGTRIGGEVAVRDVGAGEIARAGVSGLREWTSVVPLPMEAFEEDGVTLIVGVEREYPAGVRASFPRPMMPGQAEPGRVGLDVSAWGGLGGR
jgi:hypothetical protein